MAAFLRQSTASQVIELGPFVDDTDFKTAETGLSIANTDIKLRKHGGTSHGNKNSGGATHIANGYYHATLDATDTNTVGILDVHVNVAGALAVWDRFFVLEEAVYDALFASSAPGYLQPATAGRQLVVDAAGLADANVVKLGPTGSGTAQTARDIGASVLLSSGTGTGQILLSSGLVKTTMLPKNVARAAFPFLMTEVVGSEHVPATGKTVTCERSIDGGAFGAGTLANVTEIGDGLYCVDFGAGDLNGNFIVLKAEATGCDTTFERIATSS